MDLFLKVMFFVLMTTFVSLFASAQIDETETEGAIESCDAFAQNYFYEF